MGLPSAESLLRSGIRGMWVDGGPARWVGLSLAAVRQLLVNASVAAGTVATGSLASWLRARVRLCPPPGDVPELSTPRDPPPE